MNIVEKLELALKIRKAEANGAPIEWERKYTDTWSAPSKGTRPEWYAANDYELRLKPTSILTDEQKAAGWVEWHGGENPIPGLKCEFIVRAQTLRIKDVPCLAENLSWEHDEHGSDIIAYRVAEPEWVDLGPEDVPLLSVVRYPDSPGNEYAITAKVHGEFKSYVMTWSIAALRVMEINRSIPLTGKWDPNAWEPCRKEVV